MTDSPSPARKHAPTSRCNAADLSGAGASSARRTAGGSSLGGSPTPPVIGYRSDNVCLFLGPMGPISVYTRQLSPAEIMALYLDPYAPLRAKDSWPTRRYAPVAAAPSGKRPRITVFA